MLILPTEAAPHHSAAISVHHAATISTAIDRPALSILHWAATHSIATATLHPLQHPICLLLGHQAIFDCCCKRILMSAWLCPTLCACARRCVDWIGRSLGADPFDEHVVVWRDSNRPSDIRDCGCAARGCRASGVLSSGATRGQDRPDGCAQIRMTGFAIADCRVR